MAQRTVHEFLAAYGCYCAMAALLLLQPAAGMAVVPAASGSPRGTAAAADTVAGVVVPAPSSVARNKRWSTTFGGNTSNKNTTVNNAVQDCSTDSDCLDTPFTSCALDPSDKKRKCLCADGKQPLNGDCLKKPRALKTSCETDVECLPNAICKNNATLTNPRLKICACKDGFIEEKESCNCQYNGHGKFEFYATKNILNGYDADLLTFNYTILLVAVFTSWIWNDHRA